MPRILVTNDDGVYSEGLHALADALRSIGDVTVVAPLGEASAIGHALTIARPLRLERLRDGVYSVDGTPADCVNLGDDVTYSGTVGGALEGALLGTPGIAVSLQRTGEPFDFGPAAAATERIAAQVLRHGLPSRTLLNVNVPRGVPKGVKVTVQGMRNHVTKVAAAGPKSNGSPVR